MYKISNSENFRQNVCSKILLLIKDKAVIDNIELIAGNIEKGIFNYSIERATKKNIIKKWENDIFVQLYIDRLRSVYINLTNTNLIQKVVEKEIKPENIAFMTHQEYEPEKWNELIQQKIKKDASKFNDNIEASTDVYVCRRCKSRKCTYEAVQIRSSDEPMTIFVNCLNCGKNWTC
jgi:DNA-directed RNA polymerase subunit M/transcription elongation factor TFIIS